MRWIAATVILATAGTVVCLGLNPSSSGERATRSGVAPHAAPRSDASALLHGPVLSGHVDPRGSGNGASTTEAESLPDRRDPAAVLRVLRETRATGVAWRATPLGEVLAYLSRKTQLPFRATRRAQQEIRHGITVYASNSACEHLLRLVTEDNNLEWYVADGGVKIAVLGEGPELVAREFADMKRHGTRAERDRATAMLASAPAFLRARVEAELSRMDPRDRSPAIGEGAAPSGRLRLAFRLLDAPADFWRDIRVSWGSLGGPRPAQDFVAPGSKSLAEFLDDAQVEIIGRAIGKSERIHIIESDRVWFWSGEERILHWEPSGVLTLSPTLMSDGRFVRMDIRLRFLEDAALVFVPRMRITVPAGGSLIVRPGDVFPDGAGAARLRSLILTVEQVSVSAR